MPRFFMHLVDTTDVTLDPEGIELVSEQVPTTALRQARDCMAGDVVQGRLDLRFRIDVHDEDGALVHSLPFQDAVEIVSAA